MQHVDLLITNKKQVLSESNISKKKKYLTFHVIMNFNFIEAVVVVIVW